MDIYPNSINLHLEHVSSSSNNNNNNKEDGGDDEHEQPLKYLYKVGNGKCVESHYGLRLARLCFPRDVIDRAYQVSLQLKRHNENLRKSHLLSSGELETISKVQLVEKLIQVMKSSKLSRADLVLYLRHVRETEFGQDENE